MKEISINCTGLSSESELFALLAQTLGFAQPTHLDALYDCLTALSQETHITIFGLDDLPGSDAIRSMLENAEADNFWLNISMQ